MAHFRAVIKGQRGEASRLGSKNSGIQGKLQTWGWDLVFDLRHNEVQGRDWVELELVHHTTGETRQIGRFNLSTGQPYEGRQFEEQGKVNPQQVHVHRPYQPKTGEPCSCHPGVERNNCPACEGTGQRIDFAAIRARNTQR